MPEHLEVDISSLHMGDQVTVEDIEAPEGVQIMSEPDSVIAMIVAPVYEEEEEEEELDEEDLLEAEEAEDEGEEGEQGEE